MLERSTKSVAELCTHVVDCPHSTPKWTSSGAVVLRSRNIRGGRLNLAAQPSFTTEAGYKKRIRRAEPQAGDLVITREAPMGEVCMIPPGLRCCLGQRMVLLRPDQTLIDGRFLLYALQSPQVQHQIRAHEGTGSTVSNLRIPALESLRVPSPPLPEQRRIAAILGALDDKIELNRKMNQTLEEMAQAIFKSWFIDFDGHEDLVESELGPIPRGWEVGGLDRVAGHVRDKARPETLPADTRYVGLEHIPRRQATLEQWGDIASVSSAKGVFAVGDTLFGKLRPYFHKVVPAHFSGVASTDVLVIRPSESAWRWFVFGHLFSDAMVAHATASSYGTKMPRTNWKDLCRHLVAIPPVQRAAEFTEIVAPLWSRTAQTVAECQTLAELRDTLLPKLISGELRVPDAEAIVEDAT